MSNRKGFDHIGVAVVYFCHDGKGNFVMGLRSKNARDENGLWDIGGGGVEFGDSAIDTLRKEIKEEYGTDVLDYKFLGYRDIFRKHAGQKTHWLSLCFKVQVDPAQLKNGEPHKFDDVKWFTFDTLPNNLHSQLKGFFELYKKELP